MPRCYMVKKALCSKYMSVARGFETWSRGRDSPSPTSPIPVSLIENTTLVAQAAAVSSSPSTAEAAAVPSDQEELLTGRKPRLRDLSPPESQLSTSSLPSRVTDTSSKSRETSPRPVESDEPRIEAIIHHPPPSSRQSKTRTATLPPVFVSTGPEPVFERRAESPTRSRSLIHHETPLFKERSAAETEAAHDLLELSRSLPPLPPPSVAVGPQNVVESPRAENVQEISIYQPAESPIYQVNTIDLGASTTVYQQQPTGIIYEPAIVQQTSTGVFIPLSPVQEILFTYSTNTPVIAPAPTLEAPPLTPPTSECSSDIENNNPNSQPNQRDVEVQTVTEQSEVKTAAYTYDTLLVADGRSKNKKQGNNLSATASQAGDAGVEPPETVKSGRYVCCECGKQYATSSNLSRHKQTHRSIDSQSAKKCIHCGKAYVSMPALAMHVLTHKLTHSCGVCGKMFSRPWLLQGHLRSHTGEKPYGCAHCGKAFADRSNLRAHMQTHSADKNYECPKCHKSFALKSYLNKHLESACQRENGDDSDADSPGYPVASSTDCEVSYELSRA